MKGTGWLVLAAALCSSPTASAQSRLVRLKDETAMPAKRVEVAALGDLRVVAAIQNADGNLKLIVYDVDADGKFTRRDSAEAGLASVFAVTGLGRRAFVTAVKKENGELRLIHWSVSGQGLIERGQQVDAGRIDRVEVATAGSSRVVSASQDSTNGDMTKLIVWDIRSDGSFDRRGEAVAASGTRVAVAALSAKQVVSAVRKPGGTLVVTAWRLSQSGELTEKGSATGPQVSEVTLTNTASDRVVTAVRLTDGTVEVQAWDVGAGDGAVTAAGSDRAGEADHLALAAVGSTKVVTALRQADQTLKLITWQVIDDVQRRDDLSAGTVGRISVTSLGWDRIVTAIQQDDGDLKLISWADYSVGVLRQSWKGAGAAGASEPPPPPPPVAKPRRSDHAEPAGSAPRGTGGQTIDDLPESPLAPAPPDPQRGSNGFSVRFHPSTQGVDPMIAVGRDHIVVTEDHDIEFLYKRDGPGHQAGQRLPSKGGEKTHLSSWEFFSAFVRENEPDGRPNRNNINRHLRLPPRNDAALHCTNPTGDDPDPDPCMDEFYDTRVAYDPFLRRFVILSAVRGGAKLDGLSDLAARRLLAIAVSKSEDPRDGFHQWITTESNYGDWPRMAVSDGVLVVAHNSCKNPDDTEPCGSDHTDVPLSTMSLRPMMYAFNLNDMAENGLSPRNWKVYPHETGGGTIYPVVHHGTADGWTYAVRKKPGATSLQVYRFKKRWDSPPTLHRESVDIGEDLDDFREGIHFRKSSLHLAAGKWREGRVPEVKPERWSVRGLRIPVFETTQGWRVGPCPASPDCLDFELGVRASDDDANDLWSYELASMAVNADGDMILVFGRVPLKTKDDRGQEVRYAIRYDDSRGLQGSQVLRKGDTVLKDRYCDGGVQEKKLVVEPYRHAWTQETDGSGTVVCETQSDYQDYGTATVDPDGKAFWIVHAYADDSPKGYRMVGGKVVP